jgi:steroid delta-isomerase-like uncharacterized protein
MSKKFLELVVIYVLTLFLCIGLSMASQNHQTNRLDANKKLVQDWADAIANHDFNKMGELMAKDYVWHFPGRDVIGLENVKASFARLYKGFPDIKLIPEDIISDGKKVVIRWNIEGTHRGEYLGMKPTNKVISYPSISIDRVEDGKFVEGWEIYDELGLRKQLGLVLIAQEKKDRDHESRMRELLQKYMEASNNHDLETLASMTAEDAVWHLGPYKFDGKEEVLQPHTLDEGTNARLEYSNVVVKGNSVEFKLMERSDVSDSLGISALIHYPRFTFKDGLVIRKEAWKKDKKRSEHDKRIYEAYRKWIREEKPEERAKFIDPDGRLIFSRESGLIMARLAKEWRKKEDHKSSHRAIEQIRKTAAQAVKNGNVDTYVELFTEDGIYMWPNAPSIIGQKALRTWFKRRFAEYSAALKKTVEEIVIQEDWAYERGSEVAKVTTRSTGEVNVIHGKYINIYHKQSDGSWKVARRIRNFN